MTTRRTPHVLRDPPYARRRLMMLAPHGGRIPGPFREIEEHSAKHLGLLDEVQKLRGRIMLAEGALPKSGVDTFGRHRSDLDAKAWHLIVLSGENQVAGCVRFVVHPSNVPFSRLSVRRVATVTRCEKWARHVRAAVEGEIARARNNAFPVVEIGGWVLERELRGTPEGIRMALGVFAWGQIAGGCIGLTTATVKHGSSSMLRRLGGTTPYAFGESLPRYYDLDYDCEMEMLRFDSRALNPVYAGLLNEVRATLLSTPIICSRQERLQSAS